MIAKKYFHLVFVTIMALFMSAFMSAAMTLLNFGLANEFFLLWIKSFTISSLVAIPIALVVAPRARQLAEQITR